MQSGSQARVQFGAGPELGGANTENISHISVNTSTSPIMSDSEEEEMDKEAVGRAVSEQISVIFVTSMQCLTLDCRGTSSGGTKGIPRYLLILWQRRRRIYRSGGIWPGVFEAEMHHVLCQLPHVQVMRTFGWEPKDEELKVKTLSHW